MAYLGSLSAAFSPPPPAAAAPARFAFSAPVPAVVPASRFVAPSAAPAVTAAPPAPAASKTSGRFAFTVPAAAPKPAASRFGIPSAPVPAKAEPRFPFSPEKMAYLIAHPPRPVATSPKYMPGGIYGDLQLMAEYQWDLKYGTPEARRAAQIGIAQMQGQQVYQLPGGELTTTIPAGMRPVGTVQPPSAPILPPYAPTAASVPATPSSYVAPSVSVPAPPFDVPGGAASFAPDGQVPSDQPPAEPEKTGLMKGYSPFIIGGAALVALFLMRKKRK